jgi:DNA-binding SARP family transcriptional activator
MLSFMYHTQTSFRNRLLDHTMESALQIRVLGGLHIARNSAPLANFVSNKAPALLVYLAMTQRPHSRDALAALLWGEMPDTDAKNNLRQALSNLRKLAEPHLIITRETVEFNHSVPYTLDAEIFERSLTQSADGKAPIANNYWQRLDDWTSAIRQLQSAIALYQGDFLAGFFVRDAPEFEEWMLAQRARLRELALHALHTLTEFQLSTGAYGRAIDYATRLLTLDSWREEAHRQLMLALARSGQRAAALAQYAMCRRILDKELSVEPSAETTKLYERIRAAGEAIQHNLPSQPTSFIGRAQELSQLEAQLLQSDCRLLTVLGVGGQDALGAGGGGTPVANGRVSAWRLFRAIERGSFHRRAAVCNRPRTVFVGARRRGQNTATQLYARKRGVACPRQFRAARRCGERVNRSVAQRAASQVVAHVARAFERAMGMGICAAWIGLP